MISRIAAPLKIDGQCRQVSCHFDDNLFQEDTANHFGIALPLTMSGAVQKRKAEFVAGRYCAHTALSQLDNTTASTPGATIGVGANREPLWPKGVVGSITHTHGYASAVVAHCSKVRGVGVDSETWINPESEDVSRLILTGREGHADHLQLFDSARHHLTLVFSAKESLFKCLFPLVNRFFDFHSAVIIPLPSDSADGEFRFELLKDLNAEFHAGYSGRGCYTIHATCVHTAVVLKAKGQANS